MKNLRKIHRRAGRILLLRRLDRERKFSPRRKPLDLFEGYVEGDLVQIGPIEGERLANSMSSPATRSPKARALFTMATPVLDQQRSRPGEGRSGPGQRWKIFRRR